MTEHGLEKTDKSFRSDGEQPEKPEKPERKENPEKPEQRERTDSLNNKRDNPNGDYRYHKPKATTSAAVPVPASETKAINRFPETSSDVVLLSSLG
jgi:hypothetical protein